MHDITQQIINKRTPKTKHNLISAIKTRFSPRIFNSEKITTNELNIIFEAGKLAPSGRNHQPWNYYVITKESNSYSKLIPNIAERNLLWVKTAPIIIICCYNPDEETDGVNKWAQYDLGQSVFSIVLQAQNLGIYSRQIGSFDCEGVTKTFNFNSQNIPFVLVAMGRIGNTEDYKNANQSIVEKELKDWERRDKIYTFLD